MIVSPITSIKWLAKLPKKLKSFAMIPIAWHKSHNSTRKPSSPGPGRPEDAGVCQEVITRLGHKIPILGVCLGHQAICQVFGATITHAPQLMHGKSSYIQINQESPLFKAIAAPMQVARYHSLIAQKETIPECLKVIASTNEQEIMAVNHQTYPIFGVQFHPESILTPNGRKLLANFIQFAQNYTPNTVLEEIK